MSQESATLQLQRYQNALEKARNLDKEWDSRTIGKTANALSKAVQGPKYKVPIEAIKLGLTLRKAVKEHDNTAWLIAFALAIGCDCMDIIPIAGWIITWFFRPALFVFLWGKGTWKVKIAYRILLFIDFIPFLNILPLSTACVFYAYIKSKEKKEEAIRVIKVIESPKTKKKIPRLKHFPNRVREQLAEVA